MISNMTIRLLDYGCCDLCNLCYKPNHPFVKGKGVVETQSLNNCIEVSYNGFLSVKDIGYLSKLPQNFVETVVSQYIHFSDAVLYSENIIFSTS